jgi:hypothetical protein
MLKIFLLIVLVMAAIWDGFTTFYGTIQILGDGPLQIVASVLFSALILGIVLNTRRILERLNGFIGVITKFFWFVALSYDFYTSWTGNADLIVGRSGETAETLVLLGLTLLVIASPILLSTRRQWGTPPSSASGTLPPQDATRSV